MSFTKLHFFYGYEIKKADLGGVCTMNGEKEMPAKFHYAI
jgi:hypothetical protein